MASVQSLVWRPLLVASGVFDYVEHFDKKQFKGKIELNVFIFPHLLLNYDLVIYLQ